MSRANMRVLIMQNAAAVNDQQSAPNQAAPGAPVQPGPNPAASRINMMQQAAAANEAATKAAVISSEPEAEEETDSPEIALIEDSSPESASPQAEWLETATKKELISYLSEHKAGFDSTARHIARARRAELVSLVEDL